MSEPLPMPPEQLDPERERLNLIIAVQQLGELNKGLQDTLRTAERQLLQLEMTQREVTRLVKRAEHLINPPPRYVPPPTQQPDYLVPAAINILKCLKLSTARDPISIQSYTGLAGGTVRTHLPNLLRLGLIHYDEANEISITDAGRARLANAPL